MTGGTPFDFPQTDQVSTFEVPVTMFEFPQRGVGLTCVEHVADCRTISSAVSQRINR
jgi:hypothetical protein